MKIEKEGVQGDLPVYNVRIVVVHTTVCKNILGAHGVSSSENGCFDSSPCNKNNFLQNKRVKVVYLGGWYRPN